jgi:HAD superfamily hydrolase (TIGR01490 family)
VTTKQTKQAAFFDLDKTVIAKASMVAFGRPLYHGGLINRRTVLRALYGQLVYLHLGASEQKLDRIRESVLRLTRGWEQARVATIVDEALEQIVDPIIYAEAADLIDLHRAAGRSVVLVSASPAEIVVPLGRYLGADATIASRASVDEGGRYTGTMEFYAYGEFKAEAMRALAEREGIDLSESYAYSDSYTDLPMLEAVGHPVAVNPDRVLARYAARPGARRSAPDHVGVGARAAAAGDYGLGRGRRGRGGRLRPRMVARSEAAPRRRARCALGAAVVSRTDAPVRVTGGAGSECRGAPQALLACPEVVLRSLHAQRGHAWPRP